MHAVAPRRSVIARAVYGILDPIPFGCFAAALVFDVAYAINGVLLWGKGAAWLIVLGLVCAIVPRIVNLVQVWVTSRRIATGADRLDFVLNLLAIVLAVLNAFVHSRDAYAIVPANVWLSAGTVLLLVISHAVVATQSARREVVLHD
jgi:uncharacterized membrane protein